MTPGKLDLTCPQGSTFNRVLTYKIDDTPVNLTGYNARLQVREYHSAPEYVLGIDSLSSSVNIYTGGSAGTININIDPVTTASIIPGKYVYDLEIYTAQNVYRLVEGTFNVTPEVTR
jgi:hypothetical protein